MRVPNQFASEMVSASAGALAALAADRLVRSHPPSRGYSDRPFVSWKDNLAGRVADLAAAIASGRPEIFADQVAWARTAFHARGVPVADLRASLESLRAVVREELPDQVRALAEEYMAAAIERCDGDAVAPAELPTHSEHSRLAAAYLRAILEGDRHRAIRAVLEAADSGVPVPDLYLGVLAPALRETGRLWLMNEISVAEEHFVSTTTFTVLGALYARMPRKAPNGRVAVASCVEGNAHAIGARMVADFLEMDGWRVIYLGSNVPTVDLVMAITDFRPHLLALSASLAVHLPAVGRAVRAVRELSPRLPIVVGGCAFIGTGDLWKDLGADALATTGDEAPAAAKRLVLERPAGPGGAPA